jgi:hypothetical protein
VETIGIIAHDPKFYAALLALIQVILFLVRPDFPLELWVAIDGLALAVFGAMTAKTTVAEKRARALARKLPDAA